ncbi:hypothetical protein TIFTF001_027334 [Ficus carica]|uniref:Uncharacterized protein n=1 Tax=Ficus carica TaxID=3494 RepID=A0AA88DMS2_FICCA|nr:hypothetical protein TIFTF001_027334 [Ficus carica]
MIVTCLSCDKKGGDEYRLFVTKSTLQTGLKESFKSVLLTKLLLLFENVSEAGLSDFVAVGNSRNVSEAFSGGKIVDWRITAIGVEVLDRLRDFQSCSSHWTRRTENVVTHMLAEEVSFSVPPAYFNCFC